MRFAEAQREALSFSKSFFQARNEPKLSLRGGDGCSLVPVQRPYHPRFIEYLYVFVDVALRLE
jgi:hypothetical protein